MEIVMYKFFVTNDAIGSDIVTITGDDVNHIKNVLRMQKGEVFYVSTGDDREYECTLESLADSYVTARIIDVHGSNRELPVKITLFQALPKGDKMETIIQKAVELGAYAVVPVASKRAVVKLDEKKKKKKIERWNAISLAAAKQSKRNVIPKVQEVVTFAQAMEMMQQYDKAIIPYENARGMAHARETILAMKNTQQIAVFIGPEGGFAEEEIQQAMDHNVEPITLGNRILRTETAAMTVLSVLMFALEQEETDNPADTAETAQMAKEQDDTVTDNTLGNAE